MRLATLYTPQGPRAVVRHVDHYSDISATDNSLPNSVREWIAGSPVWLEIKDAPSQEPSDSSLINLDPGERDAILLALSLHADLLLMDDRRGVSAAERSGLRVTGTIGILDLAAERKLVDFGEAIFKLGSTNFRRPEALLNVLLKKHGKA